MAGALSSQAEGGFLMVEYHKSSAAFSLTAQLLVRVKLVRAITAVRSLCEDGLGGQRFLVPQHEAPAQSILTQRAQQCPPNPRPKKAADPKINGFLN
jgi:hypothetical protein